MYAWHVTTFHVLLTNPVILETEYYSALFTIETEHSCIRGPSSQRMKEAALEFKNVSPLPLQSSNILFDFPYFSDWI